MSPFVLALAAAAAPAHTDPAPPICPEPTVQRVSPDKQAKMKRLDRLPPAETYLAVLHRENGCTRPILAREWRAGPGRPR